MAARVLIIWSGMYTSEYQISDTRALALPKNTDCSAYNGTENCIQHTRVAHNTFARHVVPNERRRRFVSGLERDRANRAPQCGAYDAQNYAAAAVHVAAALDVHVSYNIAHICVYVYVTCLFGSRVGA